MDLGFSYWYAGSTAYPSIVLKYLIRVPKTSMVFILNNLDNKKSVGGCILSRENFLYRIQFLYRENIILYRFDNLYF